MASFTGFARHAARTISTWARDLKRDIGALWIAARDPRTPLRAKVLAGVVAAYALSPIDLIPDFIPVIGYLDDIIIVPIGIWMAIRMIPEELMAEFRRSAAETGPRPRSLTGLLVIGLIWLIAAVVFMHWLGQRYLTA